MLRAVGGDRVRGGDGRHSRQLHCEKLALALETVIDRTAFGMNWQMDIPGGGVALANDVELIVELELDRE